MTKTYDVAIVGGGFTGLVAALQLAKAGKSVCVMEADDMPGGLAGSFKFDDGVVVEKFYHHWFNNDVYVPELVSELGHDGDVITLPSNTGMYFNGRIWKLSSPIDLLKFTALSFVDRIRLGLLVFKVQRVKSWQDIEDLNIREWLEPLVGKEVYKVVWEPLLDAKFSVFKDDVNAVWMWKKLVLRGSTRGKGGSEELAYFKGGFGRLTQILSDAVEASGGEIRLGTPTTGLQTDGRTITALDTPKGLVHAKQFLFTPALPIIADILEGHVSDEYNTSLRRVQYLGNVCLILRLNRSLSDTYWLNVNDPGFPFVGVIEHTNFDSTDNYDGTHIVYLSRYLATQDPVWAYSDEEYLVFALKHLQKMFPDMDESWIVDNAIWRAEYAQPVTERNYSKYVPGRETPFSNGFISTMAHIYPEDRGTNYAIREGRSIAKVMLDSE